MKKNADNSKSEGGNNMLKQRKTSSTNGEIETYLSSRYEFRYNMVLGRTEYRGKNDAHFSKVGRYEINTLRREIDNDIGIITSSDNLYSIIESSFSPRISPIQEYFKRLPSTNIDCSSHDCGNDISLSLKQKATLQIACKAASHMLRYPSHRGGIFSKGGFYLLALSDFETIFEVKL